MNKSTDFSQRYDRYCRQLDKEDQLINERINWLLVSQSLLFAAVGLSSEGVTSIILKAVPWVGLFSSVGIGVSVLAAALSLKRYRKILLDKVCCPSSDPDKYYPQLHRSKPNILLGLVSPIVLPLVFCVAWIYVICLSRVPTN